MKPFTIDGIEHVTIDVERPIKLREQRRIARKRQKSALRRLRKWTRERKARLISAELSTEIAEMYGIGSPATEAARWWTETLSSRLAKPQVLFCVRVGPERP